MIRRHFWGWDRSVIAQATALLTREWTGGELDLSDTLIIVPTAESVRRLKEALAKATAAKDGAAVAPFVWAPEQALFVEQDREQTASYLASLFAWASVLRGIDFAKCPKLFPVLPAEAGWSWCIATAEMLLDLANTLGAGGWTFATVAGSDAAKMDMERWRELALLHTQYLAVLAKEHHADMQMLKSARAVSPWLPEGVKRVLVLAAPDLPPLLTRWLDAAAKQAEVTICIHAPEHLAHAFDAQGRAAPEFWLQPAALPAPIAIANMQLAANAAKQAESLVEHIAELAMRGRAAVGVSDPEVTAALKERLTLEDVRVFEPGGVAPQTQGLWHVLTCIRDLIATRSWRSIATLLRVEDVRTALCGGGEGSGPLLLNAADELAQTHMPVTLDHALDLLQASDDIAVQKLRTMLEGFADIIASFERLPLIEATRGLLMRLYGERLFTPTAPADRALLDLAEAILESATEVTEEARRFGFKPGGGDAWSLVIERTGQSMLTEPRGEVDLILQGWLELLWEEAPCIAIAGMNEEHVPGILVSHPFLPDSLRTALGLASQATRYSRDAYLLHAITAQRAAGDVRILCGQWSERGDSLRPSRLLFRGPDAELPDRVARLFPKDEEHTVTTDPPQHLAWRLAPRMVSVDLKKISASTLKSYLTCPFRFYLGNMLRMNAVDPDKRELGANEFGELIHIAFQQMAGNKAIAQSTKADEIADFLCSAAEDHTKHTFAGQLPMLVRLQLESALQRLRAAADYEAQSRMDGWRISEAEVQLKGDIMINGVPFTGKIDRVEIRENKGRAEVRLIDFKSADKVVTPLDAHAAKFTGRKRIPAEEEWQLFTAPDGQQRRWSDLQLPLYAAAMAARGITDVSVAYFNLPKNVQETKIVTWDDFNTQWINAATECASTIVQRIRDGVFWPPSKVTYDDYGELLLGDAAASVEFDNPQPKAD